MFKNKATRILIGLMLIAVINYSIKYALNAYLANHLAPRTYGDFTIALKMLMVAASLTLLGSDISAKRFLSQYLSRQDASSAVQFIAWNLKLLWRCSAAVIIILLLFIVALYQFHLQQDSWFETHHLVIHILWLTPLLSVSVLLTSFLLCNQNYYLSGLTGRVLKYILLVSFVVGASTIFDLKLSNENLFYLVLGAFFILVLMQLLSAFFVMPANMRLAAKEALHLTNPEREEWIKTSLNLALNNIIFNLVCVIDLAVVELVGHDEDMVGHYSAVLVIAGIIWLFSNSMGNYLKPKVRYLLSNKKIKEMQQVINQTNMVSIAVCFFMALAVIVFSDPLLKSFSDPYRIAGKPLIILAVCYFLGGLSRSAVTLLAFSKNERVLLVVSTIELIASALACLVGTLYFGLLGTAVGAGSVIVIKSFYLMHVAKKRLGVSPIWG